ncbi:MAG: magnesium transporter [Bacteroidetes bacterium]|nr:magnesium transporter [Bacteroidota bacterium]
MALELHTEFIDEIKHAIEKSDNARIQEILFDLFAPDIADILNHLSFEEAVYVYELLDEDTSAAVLIELREELREELLATFSSKEIAEEINNLASDDAADVINELPENRQSEVLAHIENIEQAGDIADLLSFEEGTAGSLMAKELVSARQKDTVTACIDEIRQQADNVDIMYATYVIDEKNRLVGLLSLKKLLIAAPTTLIEDIYDQDVIQVTTATPTTQVAELMQKYDLVVIPVVDSVGRLVGRITIDDVVDVIREEETDEAHKMAGIETFDEPYMSMPFLETIKKRAGWLVILFLGETLTATAMSFFEDQLAKAVILALFVPLIISSGGNTGSQASTLIIRAMALGEISFRDWWRIFKKEFLVGLTLGILLGAVGFLRIALWSTFTTIYGPHWLLVGITVAAALMGVVLWGNLAGSLLPVLLKRVKLDPAVCSAPFVATLVDVTGLIIYFSAATAILKGILL